MMQRSRDAAVALHGSDSQASGAGQKESGVEVEAMMVERDQAAPRARRTSLLRLIDLAFIALLPSFLKRICYRLFFGYRIGKRVRIGLTILDADECEIADDV